MRIFIRHNLPILTFLAVSIIIVWLSILYPPQVMDIFSLILFSLLFIFTLIFSAPLGGGKASLAPMTSVATYLVLGLVPSLWIVFWGTVIYSIVRNVYAPKLGMRRENQPFSYLRFTMANVSVKTTSILFSGLIYQTSGGQIPLTDLTIDLLLPLFLLGVTYFAIYDLMFAAYIAETEARSYRQSVRSLYASIVYEGGPIVFSPMISLIYTNFGWVMLLLIASAIVTSALMTRNLANASQHLQKQLKELETIQAVGQTLSASLDLRTILRSVYEQVVKLMPAENFYVGLYNAENDEVSFPFVVEEEREVIRSSRKSGQGLTEYVIKTRSALLSTGDTSKTRHLLGLPSSLNPAISWLGVPIIAGEEILGAMCVQSYSDSDVYDRTQQDLLTTIATQAAVAIQNARLFAQTDEALSHRVQELDSILRTIQEGILLTDLSFSVLAANRSIGEIVGVPRSNLIGVSLLAENSETSKRILEQIGYTHTALRDDCLDLLTGRGEMIRQHYVLTGSTIRFIDRSLTPVRDQKDNINGLLFVFKDISEEQKLSRLRDDMVHTIIHDLRSPLAVVKGSLEVMKQAVVEDNFETFDELVRLARQGTERLLRLVNHLLDIGKLEDDRLILDLGWVGVKQLLEEAAAQVSSLAGKAQIDIQVDVADNLPSIYIDPEHMERVLANLLDNAVNYSPNGGLIKLWARQDLEREPGYLLIGVTDNGPGISEEIKNRLFGKFQQSNRIHGRRSGSGLGLHYCKLAVEAQGGQIWVESDLGKGSTFIIRIPIPQE